jgi:RNA polymerase primary sigma factor
MEDFGIKIDNEEILDNYVTEQNEKYFKLHDWQIRAIDFFFKYNKVVYEVTTGAGKSICAIQIIKKILEIQPNSYILIVVPKNVILEKMWFPELQNAGYSLKDVGVFYGDVKEECRFTITNMQNLNKLPNLDEYDLVILDEVHNYCTERLFTILEQHKFKYLIGLSATVERTDKKHWRMFKYFDYNIFKYTPKEALQDEVLNQFNFYNIGIVMDEENYTIYESLTQQIRLTILQGGSFNKIMTGKSGIEIKLKLLKIMNERKQLVLNYILKFNVLKIICKQNKDKKGLVFNEYNKQTTKCYWHLLEEGIKAKLLHSDIDKKEREQVLNDYSNNKFNILLATKILDEGYNLPSISWGIIMAGNSTAKQTIQRLGRVLRKKEEKSDLYQIYVLNTMEEEQANERAKLFKELCTKYKEYRYDTVKGLVEL